MKAHELAKKLLEMPDLEVMVQCESWYDCSFLGPAEFVTEYRYTTDDQRIAITQTGDEVN